jgi:penicillin-binding protein 1C
VVTTTLDLELQEEVTRLTRRAVEAWERRGAGNAAVAVVDCASREVLAWAGSTGYFDDRHAGSIDYGRIPRSTGSTLKPFLYGLALERGIITPGTVVDDLQRGSGGLGNSDQRFLGPLLPRVALANSRNVPAARLLDRVGIEAGYALFRDLGLHDGGVPSRHYGVGMAIGGLPATLGQLVGLRRRHGPPNHPHARRPPSPAADVSPRRKPRVPVPGGGQDRHVLQLP